MTNRKKKIDRVAKTLCLAQQPFARLSFRVIMGARYIAVSGEMQKKKFRR